MIYWTVGNAALLLFPQAAAALREWGMHHPEWQCCSSGNTHHGTALHCLRTQHTSKYSNNFLVLPSLVLVKHQLLAQTTVRHLWEVTYSLFVISIRQQNTRYCLAHTRLHMNASTMCSLQSVDYSVLCQTEMHNRMVTRQLQEASQAPQWTKNCSF